MLIDIHCHILPGFDDGVRTMDEAVELARMEVAGGTRTLIATPHVIEKRDYERVYELSHRIQALQEELNRTGIEAKVLQGGEIYPSTHLLSALDDDLPITLAGKGRHMLVDLPLNALPYDFESLLAEILARGITPILAHPERATPFQRNPEALQPLMERGVALQVNARSLSGKYGTQASKTGYLLLRNRWAHFLSSDAHRPGREPILGSCLERLKHEFDAEYLHLLSVGSATCVLEGRDLPMLPPNPKSAVKTNWWSRLVS